MRLAKPNDRMEFEEILDSVPVSASAKARLTKAMTDDSRWYHNVSHIAQLWRRHRRYGHAENLVSPAIERLIASAIAFHDCIVEPARRDNEERSAVVWMRASVGAPLEKHDREWVAETIRATRDHLSYEPRLDIEARNPAEGALAQLRERARIWVLDLDLTSIGESEEVFDRNTAALRREALHMSEADWRAGQASFLGRLMKAPRIYRTPTLAKIYEEPARRNIIRLLTRLAN